MKKFAMALMVGLLVMVFTAGCATPEGGNTLGWIPGIGGAVAPDYAAGISTVLDILNGNSAVNSPVEGYTFQRVYRYRGTICEASDITWDNIYSQPGSAEDGAPPIAVSTNNTASVDSDEALADELLGALTDLGITPSE